MLTRQDRMRILTIQKQLARDHFTSSQNVHWLIDTVNRFDNQIANLEREIDSVKKSGSHQANEQTPETPDDEESGDN